MQIVKKHIIWSKYTQLLTFHSLALLFNQIKYGPCSSFSFGRTGLQFQNSSTKNMMQLNDCLSLARIGLYICEITIKRENSKRIIKRLPVTYFWRSKSNSSIDGRKRVESAKFDAAWRNHAAWRLISKISASLRIRIEFSHVVTVRVLSSQHNAILE